SSPRYREETHAEPQRFDPSRGILTLATWRAAQHNRLLVSSFSAAASSPLSSSAARALTCPSIVPPSAAFLRIPAMCVSFLRKRPESALLAEKWRKSSRRMQQGKDQRLVVSPCPA